MDTEYLHRILQTVKQVLVQNQSCSSRAISRKEVQNPTNKGTTTMRTKFRLTPRTRPIRSALCIQPINWSRKRTIKRKKSNDEG